MPELLVMNCFHSIDLVYKALSTRELVTRMVSNFCTDNATLNTIQDVTKYITSVYCQMRGKDFSRKLMSRETNLLKQTRHPTLAAVSNPTTHKAKKTKVVEVIKDYIDNEVEYLLFDTATGNSFTEEKGSVDDDNLLET